VFGQDATPAGHYEGTVEAPDQEIKFVLDLEQNEKQVWVGQLSLTPGAKELPLGKVDIQGEKITFELAVPNGPKFEGKWDKAAQTITGTATGPQGAVPFELKRTGEAKIVTSAPSTSLAPEFAGTWQGALEAGGRTLRLEVTLMQGEDGKAQGHLVSVDQGGQKIPMSTITQNGNALSFEIRMISGSYKGTLNEAKNEITGEWAQGGRTLPLNLKKASGQ
jgi:hypothetical protein